MIRMMSSINRWSLLFPINLRNDVLRLLRWRQILSQTELFSWLLSISMNKFFILPPSWLTWTTREVADEGFLQTHRQWKVNDANTINVKFFFAVQGKGKLKDDWPWFRCCWRWNDDEDSINSIPALLLHRNRFSSARKNFVHSSQQ